MTPPFTIKVFEVASHSGAAATAYTVPPMKLLIVTTFSIVLGNVPLGGEAWVQTDTPTKLYGIQEGVSTPFLAGYTFGRWAIVAGQALQVATDASTTVGDFHCTGYLLDVP